jgi:hypothetical protein
MSKRSQNKLKALSYGVKLGRRRVELGSTLADHELKFEDLPQKQYNKKTAKAVGRTEMSKVTSEPKAAKRYSKTRGEHLKDIVITILVTAIVAFVAGTMFANKQQARIDRAVQAVAPKVEASQLK